MIANDRARVRAPSLMVVVILVSVPEVFSGTREIAASYLQISENEAWILECREQGVMDIEIEQFSPSSKYSAVYGLKYIDTQDVSTWPNSYMAEYYGVNSIIGN